MKAINLLNVTLMSLLRSSPFHLLPLFSCGEKSTASDMSTQQSSRRRMINSKLLNKRFISLLSILGNLSQSTVNRSNLVDKPIRRVCSLLKIRLWYHLSRLIPSFKLQNSNLITFVLLPAVRSKAWLTISKTGRESWFKLSNDASHFQNWR